MILTRSPSGPIQGGGGGYQGGGSDEELEGGTRGVDGSAGTMRTESDIVSCTGSDNEHIMRWSTSKNTTARPQKIYRKRNMECTCYGKDRGGISSYQRTSLLLVNGKSPPILLLNLLKLLMNSKLLFSREVLPLRLYVGEGDNGG